MHQIDLQMTQKENEEKKEVNFVNQISFLFDSIGFYAFVSYGNQIDFECTKVFSVIKFAFIRNFVCFEVCFWWYKFRIILKLVCFYLNRFSWMANRFRFICRRILSSSQGKRFEINFHFEWMLLNGATNLSIMLCIECAVIEIFN